MYSTSTSRQWRGLTRIPRSDVDYINQRAFLSTCASSISTILHYIRINKVRGKVTTESAQL